MMVSQRYQEYKEIVDAMNAWRSGDMLDDVPRCYVEFHLRCAYAELKRLMAMHSFTVLSEKIVPAGAFDGMSILLVGIETKSGSLLWLQWHDGNKCFVQRLGGCGGHGVLKDQDLA